MLTLPRVNSKAILTTLVYKIRLDNKLEAKEHYFAECLRVIAENTAHIVGISSFGEVSGAVITKHINELFAPEDTRTAEDVFNEVVRKGGLKVV